jgi:DNA-binding MarR family transcriptional regulator
LSNTFVPSREPEGAADGEEVLLPHLSDQVSVSAALDKALDGSALWVLLAVYRIFAVLDRDQAEEVATMGLSPLQFNILMTLQRTGRPTTMGALAAMLVVKPNNLSGNINTLVERGLVRRELNSSDQRSILPVLTPQGQEFLAQHVPSHWRRLERLMYGLTREKRLQLVALLKELALSIQDEQEREKAARNSEKKARLG